MMIMAGMKFTDRVQAIAYSESRNLIFIASRDGKFYAWKLPNRWRQEWVDKFERDLLIIKKRQEYEQIEEQREKENAARKSPVQISKQLTQPSKEPTSPVKKLNSGLISEEAVAFLKKSSTVPLE
jgi:hypothetical protein